MMMNDINVFFALFLALVIIMTIMTPSVYFPLISELDPTFGLLEVSCLFCTAWINLFMRMMMMMMMIDGGD